MNELMNNRIIIEQMSKWHCGEKNKQLVIISNSNPDDKKLPYDQLIFTAFTTMSDVIVHRPTVPAFKICSYTTDLTYKHNLEPFT